ncbi:MAG: hypothetical protein ABS81_10890 [Pseudonocardia sp. SCN 72-86]|nr:MAG: hypothetical protein ABS81_10890 [Pseudonocardia sp. SCN 72-86]
MRIYVDQIECTGAGHCESIAPAVFTLGDDGLATVVDQDLGPLPDGGAELGVQVPPDLATAVADAVDVCPGACIRRLDAPHDDPGGMR